MDKNWTWDIEKMNPQPGEWYHFMIGFDLHPIVTVDMALEACLYFLVTLSCYCKDQNYLKGFEFELHIYGKNYITDDVQSFKFVGNMIHLLNPSGNKEIGDFYHLIY